LVAALHQFNFAFVDVCEIILRYYKPNPNRLRPTDRMVAHTGYLIFGRPFVPGEAPSLSKNLTLEDESSVNNDRD